MFIVFSSLIALFRVLIHISRKLHLDKKNIKNIPKLCVVFEV